MTQMTINDIYNIFLQCPNVTTDTRQCEKGSIFFALKGTSFDGNQFARQALEAGCSCVVVDNPDIVPEGDFRYILVNDTLEALQHLSALHRTKLGIPVLQITGTNGKTTTKELVSAVLSEKYRVLYTQGNLNNHIGVPRTLLRIRPEHEIAVIETGANHPGEIAFLCNMVKADYGIITNVGRAHLEGFGSFEGVKRTKGELYDDLAKRGRTTFINAFDDNLREMAQNRGLSTIPYVEGRVEDCSGFLSIQWRKDEDAPWRTVSTHLVGAYNIANVRAAITVGLHFGVSAEDIDHALENYIPTNSRSELRETASNRLIVDAYNANPSSMKVALDNFEFVKAEHKMVILGMMAELGNASREEHLNIVSRLSTCQQKGQDKYIEQVWLVGDEFAHVFPHPAYDGWRLFKNVEEIKTALLQTPPSHFTILIKGSNSQKLFQLPDLL